MLRELLLHHDVIFEWDDRKAKINFEKHGIRFETAIKAMKDKNLLFREDYSHKSEVRYDVLCKDNEVLFVVCCIRQTNTIRIISARYANRKERLIYGYSKSKI